MLIKAEGLNSSFSMASSSMASDVCYDYDVFLSFRGDDTRNNFTSHLYEALRHTGIKVFIDNKIDRGEEITTTIERVIESVKLSVIVFSPDYASSTFCLDELVKIMECRESKDQIVLPIFYKMEPSEGAYREAFAKHKAEFKSKKRRREETTKQQLKKVKRWKSAFRKALNLGGWPIDDKSVEAKLIRRITRNVLKRLNSQSKGEELMCTSIVGQTAEDIFVKIWECLMNNNISKVGIYGMGGVGKTTIATRVNDELLACTNSFGRVFWVTVSKDLCISKLQNKVAEMINLDLSKEDDERKRAAKLRKRLKTEKFLLILDDVWKAFEIEELGIPSLVSGQKLLLTSRSRRVCQQMECQPIEVNPLSQQEALDLFLKESKFEKNDSLEWREIVHSVVRECAGLPLAIVVIARRMRGVVEISEWRNILRKLKEPCKGENNEMEEHVFKPLKLSYNSLPDYQHRQCFLYYSLFPEDFEETCYKLIEYLIGEELIGKLNSRQAEFDKGNAIINELISASLLELSTNAHGIKYVKMHDVVRDMARIVMRENYITQDGLKLQGLSEETELCVNLKNVLLITEDSRLARGVPSLMLNCSEISTLIFTPYHMPTLSSLWSWFFANMQNLAVLDMSNLRNLKLLPDSISNLRNLRVLLLRSCYSLMYIPSLYELKNLWHLDVSFTKLKVMPNGMERLINLTVLDLSGNYGNLVGSFPSGVLEKLSHLQSLVLEGSRVQVEPEVLISLEKLEILRVPFFDLQKLNSYLKSGHWRRLQEYHFYYVAERGEGLLLKSLRKVFTLEEIRDAGEWKGESGIFFPHDIQNLQLLNWDSPMFDVFRNRTFVDLQTIIIDGYKDRYLFTPVLVQQLLHHVKELEITEPGLLEVELEEIIAIDEEWVNQSIYNDYPTILLPNLQKLTLLCLPNLRSIYRGRMVCPSLEYVLIHESDKLERLPFCMGEERNNRNPTIILDGDCEWWDSLQWDNSNAKSMYHFITFGVSRWDMEIDWTDLEEIPEGMKSLFFP